ncbi:methyltransferase domain-containing protein [Hydrogenobaculum acidophilum]
MNKNYEKYAVIQKHNAEYLFNIVKNLKYESVLDVGAGTGFLSKYFYDCISIDIDKNLKTYHKHFIVGEAERLPFKDRSFDLTISNFAIHLCNVELSIKEMIRVSKRYVACSFPIKGSLEGWIYDFPEENTVLELLKSKNIKVLEKTLHPIKFTNLELLKFINNTGKPKRVYAKNFISKSQIKDILVKIENPCFIVLSFLLEV